MDTPPPPIDHPGDGPSNLDDWRGLGDLISFVTDRVSEPAEGMHRAIAGRWFGLGGRRTEVPHRVYDGLTESIYNTVRLGGSIARAGIAKGADLAGRRGNLRPLWNTPKGRYFQSVINGIWGDRFEAEASTFSTSLSLWGRDGDPIPLNPEGLSLAFTEPNDRLVVLLHGFGETERFWLPDSEETLIDVLEADGFSVLLVRYNTGLPIADNGMALAGLVKEVHRAWPGGVKHLALVGHSMGGLVARSAVARAGDAGHDWVELTDHVVAIGSPHLGTPIEKGVHLISSGLRLIAESRPLAEFIDGRSAGIKDMRFGLPIDDDQMHGIGLHFVAGAVTTEPRHPLGSVFGDLVVRVRSATGTGRYRQVTSSDLLLVGGRHHASLAHDDEVYSRIREWLAPVD